MRHFDLTPLYRSTVGFDRLFNLLDTSAHARQRPATYPPYNIERTGEDAYRVTLAVAGFSERAISIEAQGNVLTVKGEKKEESKEDGPRCSTAASPRAPSSAASSSPTTSR